ncbi:MAG: hypothetical protein V1793_10560 [Pseudomonadota bacterium]
MKSIIFPFTYVAKTDAELIRACFTDASVLTVSSAPELATVQGAVQDTLDNIALSDDVLGPVMSSIREYRRWADINRGARGVLKTLIKDTPWFTSDTGVSSLRARIMEGANGRKTRPGSSGHPRDMIMEALVFLRFAQDLDRENELIDTTLDSLGRSQADLFAGLRGDTGSQESLMFPKDHQGQDDPGALMTQKRILAWSVRFSLTTGREEALAGQLFVTTSPAVLDFLKDEAEKSTKMLDIDSFKVHLGNDQTWSAWRSGFFDQISRAAAGERPENEQWPESPGNIDTMDAGLSLFRFSGEEVIKIFCPAETRGRRSQLEQMSDTAVPVCLIHRK